MAATTTAKLPRVELLHVFAPDGYAGRLAKAAQHSFTYDTTALERAERKLEISLTMPLRADSYRTTPMLPVFQTFLPEGFLKERIGARFGKIMRIDDMALLALSGGNSIGRLQISRSLQPAPESSSAETLKEIMADQGSRDLFADLCDRYLISSGISGAQPKVLLTTTDSDEDDHESANAGAASAPGHPAGWKVSVGERATLRGRQLIIKVSGDDYPALTENEYHCLNLARSIGLRLPAFWLSDDQKRLAIERFDFDRPTERYLGFEDMVSLQGKVNEQKYDGSCEGVARAIALNCSPALRHQSLHEFFSSLVLSIVVRNGDAHLKNFGLTYSDPGADDCRLSPLYDIVCTTVYLENDLPALAMAGRRAWPDRAALCAFAREHCEIDHPEAVIDKTLDVATTYKPDRDESGMWAKMRALIVAAAFSLGKPAAMARPR